HWQTAAELNNKRFDIERSPDGKQFTSIHWLDGAGTSNTTHDYTWTDPQPLEGKNFYRIKQTDLDSHTSYSIIKQINITSGGALQITPDPITGSTMTIRHHLPPGKVNI